MAGQRRHSPHAHAGKPLNAHAYRNRCDAGVPSCVRLGDVRGGGVGCEILHALEATPGGQNGVAKSLPPFASQKFSQNYVACFGGPVGGSMGGAVPFALDPRIFHVKP